MVVACFMAMAVASPGHAEKPRVLATVLPVYVFALNVAKDRADVELLMPPGSDVHEFSLKPLDVRKLRGADLVLMNGAGLELHMAQALEAARTVDTSAGIKLRTLPDGRVDPHVWLDPQRALKQVDNIADALAALDPDNAAAYKSNAAFYKACIKQIEKVIEMQMEKLQGQTLITYHDSFWYFARRYGLDAVPLAGPGAERPLPGRLKEAYDSVRENKVKAVFSEERYPPELLEKLASDLGVEVCELSTMITGNPDAELYEKKMADNADTIVRCLGGR